jgi:hypothetical protein
MHVFRHYYIAQYFDVKFVSQSIKFGQDSLPCSRISKIALSTIAGKGYEPGASGVIEVTKFWHTMDFMPIYVDLSIIFVPHPEGWATGPNARVPALLHSPVF